MVRKLAAVRETLLQDIRALLLDPVDLRDLPFLGGDGRAKWATPEFLPVDGEGILFLDELNAAPSMVQRDCYPRTQRRNMPSLRQPAIRHTRGVHTVGRSEPPRSRLNHL
jgi:MoxR-like ATPase